MLRSARRPTQTAVARRSGRQHAGQYFTLVNAAWITTVIAKNIKSRPCLHGSSTEELYSTALTGAGDVGGVMNAILEYDYRTAGVAAFSPYLAKAIANAFQPTRKQDRTYRRVETRRGPA